MPATITKHGSPDYGHWLIQCDECRDRNGRPWQFIYSRRMAESRDIAERNMADHNKARHDLLPLDTEVRFP